MVQALDSLARVQIQALKPYQSARRIGGSGDTWLNANESPEMAKVSYNPEQLNRYPEFQPKALIDNYANYAGVKREQLLASRGADEAIEVLIRSYCEPNQDTIVITSPTYGMYQVSADTMGVNLVSIDLDDDFQPNYEALNNCQAKLIFLCAPNNPTGTMLDHTLLADLLVKQQGKALVVVDEAYIEFCPQLSVVGMLESHPNLVITRTLSKAFALAGLRCGFTLAHPAVIQMLSKVIAPYPIARPVADIAAQALSCEGVELMQQRVAKLNQIRDDFAKSINTLRLVDYIFPATANYLLVRFVDSVNVFQKLSQQGIVLRDFASKARLANCVRISIGSEAEMQRTLDALLALDKES
ncbi:histidinol-phosphate transaminase [Alginatibacterium sediminis]|uniref:Histidinol-phosphate aminotransferase n=1 Tax=Alginatibacterium sediminis TaxID=2164068 RepID=A0A420EIA7_9ALTE|nr:histidinol-phosphate transaminase [Alginatibacterium sediminis]